MFSTKLEVDKHVENCLKKLNSETEVSCVFLSTLRAPLSRRFAFPTLFHLSARFLAGVFRLSSVDLIPIAKSTQRLDGRGLFLKILRLPCCWVTCRLVKWRESQTEYNQKFVAAIAHALGLLTEQNFAWVYNCFHQRFTFIYLSFEVFIG